jgi:hypothetical protein
MKQAYAGYLALALGSFKSVALFLKAALITTFSCSKLIFKLDMGALLGVTKA